jgi:EAL domain-containing protein (putative c-di-GMP-specific phosphodiesterase class I)
MTKQFSPPPLGEPSANLNIDMDSALKVSSKSRRLNILISIGNISHIRFAYGIPAARSVLWSICESLKILFPAVGPFAPEDSGYIVAHVCDLTVFGAGSLHSVLSEWLYDLCHTIALTPVATPEGIIHVWASASYCVADEQSSCEMPAQTLPAHGVPGFYGLAVNQSQNWIEEYKEDMARTAFVLGEIRAYVNKGLSNSLFLASQPIVDARDPSVILYNELLLRMHSEENAVILPAAHIQSLERTGFIAILDLHIASLAVTHLRGAKNKNIKFGVNISGLSLNCSWIWKRLFREIGGPNKLGERLFIEITETSKISNMDEAKKLIDRFHRVSCQVCLDDFGTGSASIGQLISLSPDVIKIDQVFLRRALNDSAGRMMLKHMIGLGKSLLATVVVEGVESYSESRLALQLGATWQQGNFWEPPSSID